MIKEMICTNCCQYVEEMGEDGECVICGEKSVMAVDERGVDILEEERQRGNVVFAMDIADAWRKEYDMEIHFPNE